MKAELLQNIKNRISEAIPEIAFVDLYRNQDRLSQENYPFPLPAVLVEFAGITWDNKAAGHQMGECSIRLHLIVLNFRDSFLGAEAETQAMGELDIAYDLWNAVEGLSGEKFGALNRKNEEYAGGKWLQSYVCPVHESKTNNMVQVSAQANINVN